MLGILSNKPKRKWHIPALSRMILDDAESEDDELIRGIETDIEPTWQLEPVQDGEELVRSWDGIKSELEDDIDDIDFALDEE